MHEKHDVLECRKLIIRDPAGGHTITLSTSTSDGASGLWISVGKNEPLGFLACEPDGVSIGLHTGPRLDCPSAMKFWKDGRVTAQSTDPETGHIHVMDLHTGGLKFYRPKSVPAPVNQETPA